MTASDAFVIDPTGRDNHGEAAQLRTRGAATRVVLPDGVAAWSVTSHDVIKRLLRDPNVSKDPNQHWRAWRDGEITPDWPLSSGSRYRTCSPPTAQHTHDYARSWPKR
jgi:hypothetical protein